MRIDVDELHAEASEARLRQEVRRGDVGAEDDACECRRRNGQRGSDDVVAAVAHAEWDPRPFELLGQSLTLAGLGALGARVPEHETGTKHTKPTAAAHVELTRELFDQWHIAMRSEGSEKWWKTRGYHYAHLAKHLGTLGEILNEGPRREYNAVALARCSAENLKKELGTLRAFARWAPICRRPRVAGVALPIRSAPSATPPFSNGRRRSDRRPSSAFACPLATRREGALHRRRDRKGSLRAHGDTFPRAIEVLERRAAILESRDGGLLFGQYQPARRGYWFEAAIADGIDERRAKKISLYDFRRAAGSATSTSVEATSAASGSCSVTLGRAQRTGTPRGIDGPATWSSPRSPSLRAVPQTR
jgi:hypothetical protein